MGSNYEIEEFQLSSDPQHLLNVHGRSLQELDWDGAWCSRAGDPGRKDLIANQAERQLTPGQLLIVLGSRPSSNAFRISWERRSTALKPWPAELAIRPIPTILRAQTLS